jgi:hypothetical protein
MEKELQKILEQFANSEWDLIDGPTKAFLSGENNKDSLITAIRQADKECGSCGCEFDPLYKQALTLLQAV